MEAFLHNTTLAILVMAVALLVDTVWGEPPAGWHPVVWIGHFLGWAGTWVAPAAQQITPRMDVRAFARGALAWLAGAVVVAGLAWGAAALLARLPVWAHVLCLGLILKPLMAWRMLREEVMAVSRTCVASSMCTSRLHSQPSRLRPCVLGEYDQCSW